MQSSLKLLAMLGLVALAAACAREEPAEEEYIVVDPDPISVEPTHTGKYK